MQRRDFIKLVGASVAFPFAADAQQAQPVDDVLRAAVERKEVAGVVAMAADRNGVIYQGAFGLADIGEARPAGARCAVPDRIDDQGDHLGRRHAAHRAGQVGARRSGGEVSAAARQAAGVRSRSTPPPAPTSCGRPPSPSPCGSSSRTRPASATPSRARRCAISSRAPARSIRWARSCSSPASNGSTAPARIGSAAWSRRSPGQPLEDYFRQHIFEPLKMSDTFYYVPQDKQARLVTVNRRQADGSLRKEATQPPMSGFTRNRRRRPVVDGAPTTSASRACCSTAASSTVPACCRPSRSTRWPRTTSAPSAFPR